MHFTAIAQQIDFTNRILPKGGDADIRFEQQFALPATVGIDQPPSIPSAIITIEINTIPFRHRTAINVSACNRASAFCMAVLRHREHVLTCDSLRVVIMIAFVIIPAKVRSAARISRDKVDFLPLTLPYICDVEITCELIKGNTPGIAK